jgi:hypothetical protein
MPITPIDLVMAYEARRRSCGAHIARMIDVQRMYDGDIVIPLPELDENERPAVANLLLQGVDQLGMRASSVGPDLDFPSASPGSDAADETARHKRKAVLGWFDMNQKQKKEARRCRYLVAYGCGPVMVKPVGPGAYQKRSMPYWHVLDPLASYPAPSSDKDDIEPRDIIVVRHVTLAWLQQRYPKQADVLYKGPPDRSGYYRPDTRFELLEYNDAAETVLVVKGAPRPAYDYNDPRAGAAQVCELERTPNRAEMCLAVSPGRITLSRLQGHFDQIIGMFMAQARMTAYEQIAVFRGIFPELWVVSHPNSPSSARIVQVADGKQGVIGQIDNGTILPVTTNPGPATTAAIDRLERGQRVAGSIPADWGGESATNIRTAKRGDQVSSSAVDPTLGELQTILAESHEAEIVRAIAVEKGWYGGKRVSFYMPRSGKVWGETFVPNQLFDNDFCWVKYSMPGVDAAGIPIELGQRTQTGMLSMDTARQIDPLVEDAEHERDQVEIEGLRTALLKGLEQQGATGQLDPQEVALIAQYKRQNRGLTLEECIIKAHKDIQKQQASLATAEPGAPETQPGLSPAAPAGAAPPSPGGPPPLAQLLGGLRGPTQESPAEQQLSPPAGG